MVFWAIFALPNTKRIMHCNKCNDLVAQLVEQYTFNVWVLGSSPSQITKASDFSGAFLFYACYFF